MKTVAGVLAACVVLALLAGVLAGAWGRTPAGNTALIVPFSVGPALLAAGWAWLALAAGSSTAAGSTTAAGSSVGAGSSTAAGSSVGAGPSVAGGLLVHAALYGAAALVLTLLIAFLPVLVVNTGIPPLAGLIALAVPVVLAAPIGAWLAARVDRPRPGRGWGVMPLVVALLVLFVLAPTGAAYVFAPLLVPLVLDVPLAPDLALTGALAQRIVGAVLLPIVVIVGLFAGMSVGG